MRKLIVFMKLHWLTIIVALVVIASLIGSFFFLRYSFLSFMALESFSKKQMAGNMAMFFPVLVITQLLTIPLMIFMQFYMLQGGFVKMFQTRIDTAKVHIKWDEVIGMEGAKKEAWEIVKLLKDRHLIKAIGGKIIKGTMMIGPPGCGKTYLAKAIASECGLPFLPAVGSDFVGMFVGQGAAQMRTLFKQARALAKLEGGCIIFIDEIDSFARPRQEERGFGGATSHNATINQFLTEMDGLRQTENNIVVLAATNVSEYDLDTAVMRSGRFDRKIYISRPNLKERKQLFDFYLKKFKVGENVNPEILAKKCLWFSPADIENMIRESSLIATRDKRDTLVMKDLSEAYDRIIFGMKSNIQLSEKERIQTAYHEAGHAIIGYILHPTDDIIKATIIPRRGALGMVSHRPSEEQYCPDKNKLLADIKVAVASYAAEKIKFGITTHGVGGSPGSDFGQAMNTARTMVWSLGMGKTGLVGDFDLVANYWGGLTLSDKTKEVLDNDVQDILQGCIKEVDEILRSKKEVLEEFAQELLKKEELEYDEIEAIFKKHGIEPATRKPQSV
ncbi:MAG: AAA family ATPase [Candidatus Omnitrophica bacterium]|nr:AAA family ATPase [Candidatus Omnitrophota bacterium]